MKIAEYLTFLVEKQGSDLFFSPGFPVLLKVEGVSHPINKQHLLTPVESKTLAYALMKEQNVKAFEANWECNFAISLSDLGRFRVNVMRH